MTDILDIKPPIPYGTDPIILMAAAAAVAIFLLISFLVLRKLSKGRLREASSTPVPAHVTALAALENLEGMDSGQGKAFYFLLTDILRGYVEQRFRFAALEMTSEELSQRFDDTDIAEADRMSIISVLQASDLIKFANRPAASARMGEDLSRVKAFVLNTVPTPEENDTGNPPASKTPTIQPETSS
jgi:hypothetical protein